MKKSVLAVVLGLAFAGSVLACDAGGHKTSTPSAPSAPSAPAAPAPTK